MKKSIYSKEHKELISKLKQARKDIGFDQKKTAELLSVSQSYISKVESGQLRIDIIQLREFARIYKKDISCFIEK